MDDTEALGFLFAFVTLTLGFVLVVFAVEVIPSLPVAKFLKLCLVPIFLLGAMNRCFETWETVSESFVMSTTDAATFASRSVQLLLFVYGTLRYFREGPSGYRGRDRHKGESDLADEAYPQADWKREKQGEFDP